MTNRRLLIIEDDPGLQQQMRWCFDEVTTFVASNLIEAEAVLRKEEPQVITLDLGLPPEPGGTGQGFACLQLIHRLLPTAKTIVITGREEREPLLEAISLGAFDVYQKPIDSETLQFVVGRAFRISEIEEENRRLKSLQQTSAMQDFISSDESVLNICSQVQKIATSDINVLILGETGTGKEIVARNLHLLSNRSALPFVAINCAAIPVDLLESELFGHEKGAFTGAHALKHGRIEDADGGTLFLDEIGDMPKPLQAKILRFLQERTFERIGGNSTLKADVRVVAATHADLASLIERKEFREDLYFRLCEIVIELPPLRDRGGDSVLLATHFADLYSEGSVRLSSEARAAIANHDWPGNVREVENRLKRAVVLCENGVIEPEDLQLADSREDNLLLNLKSVRAQAERSAIQKVYVHTRGNISNAARLLGVSRPTLYNLIEKYEIEWRRKS